MPEKSFLPVLVFAAAVLLASRWMPAWAIRRRALVGVLTAALAAWGILCLRSLPVELMPNAASQTVTVTVNVRGGMAPSDVETLIARPLEETLGDLPHLTDLFASAKKDKCVMSLTFDPGVDMKWATAQVHERMERALPRLPPEIERPVVAHYEEADSPVYIAAFTSPTLTPEEMRRVVEEKLKDRLQRVAGVANVEVGGGRERKILVEVDRDKLLAYHLPIQKIVSLLGRRNVAVQVGSVAGEKSAAPVRFVGTFKTVDEFRKVVVSRDPGGGTILLENVATVSDSYMEPESLSRLNGRSAVSVYVQKESSANARRTARGAEEALEKAWADLPAASRSDMKMVEVSNQALGIEAAIRSVRMSLVSGMLLIVLVLCIFQPGIRPGTRRVCEAALGLLLAALTVASVLGVDASRMEVPLWILLLAFAAWAAAERDLRPAFIVGGAIPLSSLFSFILFKLCGVTLNVMSLFGLALGVGMLVDNGIVVTQGIYEAFKAARPGSDVMETTRRAAEAKVLPMIGATTTNAVVFVPFLFLSQDLRILYTDVAVAVAAALFGSVAVALTVVTLLTAKDKEETSKENQVIRETALFAAVRGVIARSGFCYEAIPGFRFWKNVYRRLETWGCFVANGAPRNDGGRERPPFLQKSFDRAARLANHLTFLSSPTTIFWFLGIFAGLWLSLGVWAAKILLMAATAGAVLAGFLFFRRYGRWEEILNRRFLILGWAGALFLAASAILALGTERDFQTSGEADEFVVFVELSSGARLNVSDSVVRDIESAILKDPAVGPGVKTLVSRVEGWSSKVYVTLKPRAQRRFTSEQAVARLREKLKDAGRDKDGNAFVHFSSPRQGAEIGVRIYGPDYAVLEDLARRLTGGMSKIKGLEDVKMRYRPGRPEVYVEVDPIRAALNGLTAESVAETVHALMRGLRATMFRTGANQIETIVRLREEDRDNLSSLPDLPLFNRRAPQLRLGNVASLHLTKMPNEISRRNRERFIEITANRAGISLGGAAGELDKVIAGAKFPLGYYATLDETYQEMARGLSQLLWGIGAMVFLVYLVLVLLFESLVQPFVIMTTVPLCVIGVAWGLTAFGSPLTNGVLVGVMMLGGIVVNNALMLLDRFNNDPPPPGDARALGEKLFAAARERMRPIFLTAGCAVLNFFPMLLDASEGAALWRPLSITMVFGLLVSTVLTLYVVPCVAYAVLKDLRDVFFERKSRFLSSPFFKSVTTR